MYENNPVPLNTIKNKLLNKMKLYVDTSVFGGLFDDIFQEEASLFFEYVRKKGIKIVYSQVTEKEIEKAPTNVKGFFYSLENVKYIKISKEMEFLAQKYIEQEALRKKDINDAEHIACATLSNVNAIVSFNFKHIVNMEKITKYNAINLANGYRLLNIYLPSQVIDHEKI